jgi:hypothetical protein
LNFKDKYKMLFIFIAVIAAIWIIEAAVHVVFFHKQNFFKEVFTIEVHWEYIFSRWSTNRGR